MYCLMVLVFLLGGFLVDLELLGELVALGFGVPTSKRVMSSWTFMLGFMVSCVVLSGIVLVWVSFGLLLLVCLLLSALVMAFCSRMSFLWSDMKDTFTRLDLAISTLLFRLISWSAWLMFMDSSISLFRGSLGNLPRTFISQSKSSPLWSSVWCLYMKDFSNIFGSEDLALSKCSLPLVLPFLPVCPLYWALHVLHVIA